MVSNYKMRHFHCAIQAADCGRLFLLSYRLRLGLFFWLVWVMAEGANSRSERADMWCTWPYLRSVNVDMRPKMVDSTPGGASLWQQLFVI